MRGAFWNECCWPSCEVEASARASLPLCDRHMIRVYREVEGIMKGASTAEMLRAIDGIIDEGKATRSKPGFVYIIQFSDRVKIGFTEDLARRLKELPHDRVLAVTPGSLTTEKQFHRRFEHLRIRGEWFQAAPDLLNFAHTLPSMGAAT